VVPPTAKSLILDLLGTLRPGSAMPIAALVEVGETFGIGGNAVRVAVARLTASARIVRDERGRYRLGERVLPVGRRVRSWRDLANRTRPWRGGWVSVHAAQTGRAGHRHRVRALRMFGFAHLQAGLWVRPDNLAERVGAVRDELRALGLPEHDLVAGLHELDAATERRARGLWDVAGLRRSYRRSLADLESSRARLPRLSVEEAMVESFLLGGRVIRELVLDPLLPDDICPSGERRALVDSLRDYDRAGRLLWAALLVRWDVPSLRAPVDSRADEAPVRVTG
jgi:phenylacetic acid degradation operon negative regulatory protein